MQWARSIFISTVLAAGTTRRALLPSQDLSAQRYKLVSDLEGQLACRGEDEGEDAKRVLGEELQDWKCEGGSFATSGLGGSQNVLTFKNDWNTVPLYVGGAFDTHSLARIYKPSLQSERSEASRFLLSAE